MELFIRNHKTGELLSRKLPKKEERFNEFQVGDYSILFLKGQYYVDTKKNKIIHTKKYALRNYTCLIVLGDTAIQGGDVDKIPEESVINRITLEQVKGFWDTTKLDEGFLK